MNGSRARVMSALLWEEAHGRIPTVRGLAAATSLSIPTVHAHLVRLRGCGLCDWEPGDKGTLHSTVAVVVGPWAVAS